MVRLIAFFVGLTFVGALLFGFVAPREPATVDLVAKYHLHPKEVHFANDGIFGTFDRAQLQRGFKVYTEVCAACHSLHRVAFRNLGALGFSAAEVKAIAKAHEVPSLDPTTGEPAMRTALPSDNFYGPYPNDIAARAANNNALPPDLSLITKAREDGPAYLHSLLTGYKDPPADWKVSEGLYYNPYFKSLNLAMPPPLAGDGQVEYTDGTPATIENYSKDVSAFLTWAAEPALEQRKRIGVGAVIFLLILTALSYFSYRRVWSDIKARTKAGIIASA